MHVGTLVLNNDLRHPAVVAREAAALDQLTDGRFELGLGAGHSFPEYARVGIPFDPPGTRISRLAESAAVIRRLIDGETVDFAGRFYKLAGERCYPVPRHHVPILLGGGRRVLGLAARQADIVGFTGLGRTLEDGNMHESTFFGPAGVDDQVAWVKQCAGERLLTLEFQALVQQVEVTDRPIEAAERFGARAGGVSVEDVLGSPYALIGSIDAIAEKLVAVRERWGHSYFTIRWPMAEALAPVVARLAGT